MCGLRIWLLRIVQWSALERHLSLSVFAAASARDAVHCGRVARSACANARAWSCAVCSPVNSFGGSISVTACILSTLSLMFPARFVVHFGLPRCLVACSCLGVSFMDPAYPELQLEARLTALLLNQPKVSLYAV